MDLNPKSFCIFVVMIDQSTIQKVFDAADIYEIVSDFVHLKKRGVNYVGCCPFHNEKTGSFTVSPSKGIYKCFGCGKGGNVVNFIMEHEQMSYIEAIKYLAARYNIIIEEKELTDEQKKEKTERESMLIVTKYAYEYFVDQLLHSDEGISVGLSYFKQRGLDDSTIEKFGLGYSPEEFSSLTKKAIEEGYKKEYLVKTGLSIENERGAFDRFRARVIFPIRDIAGKVIAFGGRIMKNDTKVAKYLNSPESEIYHKSRTLYGIYFAKKSIVQQNKCFLVEGYLDVISFHMKGVENTVASSGTSLTVEQIRLIRRLTSNITVIYDGDAAGIKASLRGIDLILEEGLNVKIVSLPEGEDPDSFARKMTPQELNEYITRHETDFIKFKAGLLMEQAGNDPIEHARLITDIVRSISLIPNNITRSVYIREASAIIKTEENILYTEVANLRKEKNLTPYEKQYIQPQTIIPHSSNPTKGRHKDHSCETEEMVLIRYLLLFGERKLYEEEETSVHVGEYIIQELQEDDLSMLTPALNLILTEFVTHYKSDGFNIGKFFTGHPDPHISNMVANILSEPYELSKIWKMKDSTVITEEMVLSELLPKIVDNYKMKRLEMMSNEIHEKILEMQNDRNEEELFILLKKKSTIDNIRIKLNNKLRRTGIK